MGDFTVSYKGYELKIPEERFPQLVAKLRALSISREDGIDTLSTYDFHNTAFMESSTEKEIKLKLAVIKAFVDTGFISGERQIRGLERFLEAASTVQKFADFVSDVYKSRIDDETSAGPGIDFHVNPSGSDRLGWKTIYQRYWGLYPRLLGMSSGLLGAILLLQNLPEHMHEISAADNFFPFTARMEWSHGICGFLYNKNQIPLPFRRPIAELAKISSEKAYLLSQYWYLQCDEDCDELDEGDQESTYLTNVPYLRRIEPTNGNNKFIEDESQCVPEAYQD